MIYNSQTPQLHSLYLMQSKGSESLVILFIVINTPDLTDIFSRYIIFSASPRWYVKKKDYIVLCAYRPIIAISPDV